MNLLTVLLMYVAPLAGTSVTVYDCNAHPHSTTCRVRVDNVQSTKRPFTTSYDFGVRARWIAGAWQITGPLTNGNG